MRRGCWVVALLGLLLALPGFVRAQAGFGGMLFGTALVDVDPLNETLEPHGYKSFSSSPIVFGGWGAHVGRLWIVGGSGWGLTQERTSQAATQKLTGGMGFFDIGRLLFSTRLGKAYAMLGFGGGGWTLEMAPRPVKADFGQILRDPQAMVVLQSGQVLAKAGVQLHQVVKLSEKGDGLLALIGVRVEYIFGLNEAKWQIQQTDVYGAPELSSEGLYVRLVLGIGGGVSDGGERD